MSNPPAFDWQDALNAPQSQRRQQAIAYLQSQAITAALPELVICAQHDPDAETRSLAARACRVLSEQLSHPRDPYGVFRI